MENDEGARTAEPQARRKSETHLDFRFRIFTFSRRGNGPSGYRSHPGNTSAETSTLRATDVTP